MQFQRHQHIEQINKENPLHKLGWYKCQNVEIPMHVKDYDENEEEFYRQVVKPKEKPKDWRMLMTSLKERISYLYHNKMFSDIVVIPKQQQDKQFPAHRFILALQSVVFQKMFYGSLSSREESKYYIETSENILKKLLRYIYAVSEPSVDDLAELLEMMHLSDLYMIHSLCAICEKQAIQLLDDDNACKLFQTAYLLNLEDLRKACLNYYNKNFEKFLSSPYFVSLNQSIVLTLYDIAVKTNRIDDFTPYLMQWCRSELHRKELPVSEITDILKPFLLLHVSET